MCKIPGLGYFLVNVLVCLNSSLKSEAQSDFLQTKFPTYRLWSCTGWSDRLIFALQKKFTERMEKSLN